MDTHIPIPNFKSGSEPYDTWRYKFMLLLEMKGCKEAIECEDKPNSITTVSEWNKLQTKAKLLFASAVDVEIIMECETAKQMMDKLDSLYMKRSELRQALIERKLSRLRFNENENPEKFFEIFERLIKDLKNAGATVDRKRKLTLLIITLPESLDHLTETIDLLPEENRTVDYIREKILIRRAKKDDIPNSPDGIDNSTEMKHDAHVFKTTVKSDGKICFSCNEKGHIAQYCPKRGNHVRNGSRKSYRGQGRGSHYQRGRYRGGGNNSSGRSNYNTELDEMPSINSFNMEINTSDIKKQGRINWILDSGSTNHLINNDAYFVESVILKNPVNIKVGNGNNERATKIGNIKCNFNGNVVDIKNVYYSENINRNLLSASCILKTGNSILFKNCKADIFNSKNSYLTTAILKNGLFEIESDAIYINNTEKVEIDRGYREIEKEHLHRLLGHVNFKDLYKMCRYNVIEGLPNNLNSSIINCEICTSCKMTRKSFENNRSRATGILEIIHTDVKYFDVVGYEGSKYVVSFIDDFSHIASVYCIKSKDEVFNCFKSYCNYVTNLTGHKINEIRCDSGTEFLNRRFYELARDLGFRLRPSPPYVHELNGVAERFNRTIMDRVRCLRKEAGLEKKYWPEMVAAATYIGNRLICSSTHQLKSPYEIFFGKKPSIKNLYLYGSKSFVHVPDEHRKTQDYKAREGILVGFSDVGYRILVDGKVIVARDVKFIEKDKPFISLKNEENGGNVVNSREEISNVSSNDLDEIRKSNRSKKFPDKYQDFELYHCVVDIPKSVEEALTNEQWKKAMEIEYQHLNENKTWELVELPKDKKVIGHKWVFVKKTDGMFKARLVALGYQQPVSIEENWFSPVVSYTLMKVFLAISCKLKHYIHQFDVVTAFLHGEVKSEVYMTQPKGFSDNSNKVCLLKKALYGLRESPRCWFECFHNYVLDIGFVALPGNCLYVLRNELGLAFLALYVDDLLVSGSSLKMIERIKDLLFSRFRMKHLGEVKTYLGINISYDRDNQMIKLDQGQYIKQLATKFGIVNSRSFKTPMEQNLKLESDVQISSNTQYRSLIGALLYLSMGTRPDISFSVNYLSRFQDCSNESHFKYAKRVLAYVFHTDNLCLNFSTCKEEIVAYSDADWGCDPVDRKSVSGIIIKLFGCPVFWSSRKQRVVTRSSCFAECHALADTIDEVKFIRSLLIEMGLDSTGPAIIYEDNSSTLSLANNCNFTKRSKHLDINIQYVFQNINSEEITVKKVDSSNNLADVFTKALGREKFFYFRQMLCLE